MDVAAGLAALAVERKYTRPTVHDGYACLLLVIVVCGCVLSLPHACRSEFTVIGGRHPVVEAMQFEEGQTFVRNDCNMSQQSRLWLVTGSVPFRCLFLFHLSLTLF